MTLYLIGIGLYDEHDITIRGLEVIKKCDVVYLEHYTSILGVDKTKLEELYGKEVLVAPRSVVEQQAEELLIEIAKEKDVALLIVGDVFGATTHVDLLQRARDLDVDVQVVFNASILNAVGIVGLELYKYGKTTSIVFPEDNWLPATPYEVIKNNLSLGLHTLCLLDIKVAELSKEEMREQLLHPDKQQAVSSLPRFMNVREAIDVLLRLEEEQKGNILSLDTMAVGVARVGHPDMNVVAAPLSKLKEIDFGAPLHSLIIPGKLHHVEEEALAHFTKYT